MKQILGLLAACSWSSLAFAADASVVVKAVEAKYTKVTGMKANFVQTTRNEVFGDESQGGELILKRPRQMFWNFTSGPKKQFVTNGKTMWVYSEADKQVIRYDDLSGSTTADMLLGSLDTLDELFTVDLDPADKVGYSLDLVPKKEGNVKKLHLELSADYLVEKVIITDSFDSVTELAFAKVQLNANIPDSTFQFKKPAGVEEISAGGK